MDLWVSASVSCVGSSPSNSADLPRAGSEEGGAGEPRVPQTHQMLDLSWGPIQPHMATQKGVGVGVVQARTLQAEMMDTSHVT